MPRGIISERHSLRRLADGLIAVSYLSAMSGQDLAEASQRCRRAVEITESLASIDPANAEAQQDLSSAHFVTARVYQARADLLAAADHYRWSLAILEPLVAGHPGNVETAFDLARVRRGLAQVSPTGAQTLAERRSSGPSELSSPR